MNNPPFTCAFVIWSREHWGWWGRNSFGYTRNLNEAGQYSYAAALEIVTKANELSTDQMEEIMIPLELAQQMHRSILQMAADELIYMSRGQK